MWLPAALVWASITTTSVRADLPCTAVVNGDAVRPALEQAASRRIDVVGIGDSNQLRSNVGWTLGIARAIHDAGFAMYASALIPQNRNGDGNQDVPGVHHSLRKHDSFMSGLRAAPTGAPSVFEQYGSPTDLALTPASPFRNHMYCYADAAIAANGTISTGMEFAPIVNGQPNAIGVDDHLRYSICYGQFEGEGDGGFTMSVRNATAGVNLANLEVATENPVFANQMAIAELNLPAAARPFTVQFRQLEYTTSPDSWRGPIFTLYHRVENVDRAAGFSHHTWGNHPGKSSRFFLGLLLNLPEMTQGLEVTDTYKQYYFQQVRRLQNGDPIVIFWINHGLNDRTENNNPSLGPNPHPDSSSKAGFKDNMQGIINKITEDWVASGGEASQVYFILMPSHRKGDGANENTDLENYREASAELALENPRTCFINLATLISAADMEALHYYQDGGPPANHLSPAGYDALGALAVQALLDSPETCPADLNNDNMVGFDDLVQLLAHWGICPSCPEDLDCDDTVGFDDLVFLLAWWGPCP